MRSCLIDGEAIVSDAGLAVFELIRSWRHDDAVLCTFDLLELDGEDLRRLLIEARKAVLAQLLRRPRSLAATAGRGNFKQSLNFTLCNFHKFIECEVCKCLRSHATNIRRSL
jgi:ATP-dependent DNA ligase